MMYRIRKRRKPVPGEALVFENAEDAVQVVDRAFHGGADVDVDNRRLVLVQGQLVLQGLVVDLSHGERWDALSVHAVVPGRFENAVVRLPAAVQDAVWVALSRKQDPVQVALCPTCGDITIVLERGKEKVVNDFRESKG